MKPTAPFSPANRLKSFVYAGQGLKTLLTNEHNTWLQLLAAAIIIVCGFVFHISEVEWCLMVIVIGMVLMAEAFNTSLEKLTDMVSPEYNEKAKKVKDLAAAAVLLMAMAAMITGLIIFVPKVYVIFH